MTPEAPLTIRDITDLTGFSRDTVVSQIREGHLRAKKIGAQYRVTVASYHAWLEPDDEPRMAKAKQRMERKSRAVVGAGVGTVAHLRSIERGTA